MERNGKMLNSRFTKALEAFAVGDAMGMPTEFMTMRHIRKRVRTWWTDFSDPALSPLKRPLPRGSVTDDTEQVLYLLDEYSAAREVTVDLTVKGLLRWMKETGAVEKGYIGPSSRTALEKIERGEEPETAGKGGTTCGAPMRVLAPSLYVKKGNVETLKKSIWACTVPTHNTNTAMESAAAMGFALHAAAGGASFEEIVNAVKEGSEAGRAMSKDEYIGASSGSRFINAMSALQALKTPEELMTFIYEVIGTTMESNEIVPAALSVFAFAGQDVWLAIRIGASVGGDTDTIAALAGAMSALHRGGHNIPDEIVNEVIAVNRLDLSRYGDLILEVFEGSQ